jgi:uncharacterized integral membrane protein
MAGDFLRKTRLVLATILTMLVIVVAFQNTEIVTIQLLFWNLTLSRILVLFFTFLLGAFAGILGSYFFRASRKSKVGTGVHRSKEM